MNALLYKTPQICKFFLKSLICQESAEEVDAKIVEVLLLLSQIQTASPKYSPKCSLKPVKNVTRSERFLSHNHFFES